MTKMRVRSGCTLLYPDGSSRGMSGYVVDIEADGEEAALNGQMTLLKSCADFFSADPLDSSRMVAPKKKAAKKTSKKSSK